MSEFFDLTAGEQRLRIHRWGPADAPVVVLVHGYPDTHAVWRQIALDLAKDHHVVAFDARGAGASSIPRRLRDYHLSAFSSDLKAVLDHVSPHRPVHLVGHDWGSIHSWESVTDAAFHPRLASFTSMSGPCLDHAGHWLRDCIQNPTRDKLRKLALQGLRSWYIAAFHLPFVGSVWQLGLASRWPQHLARTEGATVERSETQGADGINGVAMYRANIGRGLLFPRQRRTEVPVQVLAALHDLYVTPALSEQLHAWVPHLWRRELQAGHWSPLTHAAHIAEHVRDFVACVESGVESSQLRSARLQGQLRPKP